MGRLLAQTFAVLAAVLLGCETYTAPPEPTIEDAKSGVLSDVNAPLVLDFSKSIDAASLSVKVALFQTDLAGNLYDEDDDPTTTLKPLFSHDPDDGDRGGVASLDADGTRLVITPSARFPVGTKLIVIVEPGLSDGHGNVTGVRRRLLFSYDFKCAGNKGTRVFPSGTYFLLLDVEQPIGTQIRLLAAIEVDAATGLFRGQFTNAQRNPDRARCGALACSAAEACRLLPAPSCVAPSQKATSVDEFSDFVPNSAPPTGYSFTVTGCAEDQGADVAGVGTAPANLVVQTPPVSVNGLVMNGSFQKDGAAGLLASGSITGDDVVFGTSHLGAGHGTMHARLIPADQIPTGVPQPPKATTSP